MQEILNRYKDRDIESNDYNNNYSARAACRDLQFCFANRVSPEEAPGV